MAHIPVRSLQDLGKAIWAARMAQGIRQDDAAGAIGVSEVSLGRLEAGEAPGARLENVLRVLSQLGIHLYLDLPESAANHYSETGPRRRVR
jgi:transcriptional regulator with XRE-family HTH domain